MRSEILILRCIFLHHSIWIQWSRMSWSNDPEGSRRPANTRCWQVDHLHELESYASPLLRARFLTPSPAGRSPPLLLPLPRSISKHVALPHQRGERQSGAPHGNCARRWAPPCVSVDETLSISCPLPDDEVSLDPPNLERFLKHFVLIFEKLLSQQSAWVKVGVLVPLVFPYVCYIAIRHVEHEETWS
jgi:hypothetical protein